MNPVSMIRPERPATRVPLTVWLTLALMLAAVIALVVIAMVDSAGKEQRQEITECQFFHVRGGYTLGEAEDLCRVVR